MSECRVVLDTDFINLITEFHDGDAKDLFKRIFSALNKKPVVHPFVAQHELHCNAIAQALIEEGELLVIDKSEFLPQSDELACKMYRKNFSDMYNQITKKTLPASTDIWLRRSEESYGEIHSILMAVELGLPLFYSNDGGAKQAANYYAKGRLNVVNASELANDLSDSTVVISKERKYLKKYKERAEHERQQRAHR